MKRPGTNPKGLFSSSVSPGCRNGQSPRPLYVLSTNKSISRTGDECEVVTRAHCFQIFRDVIRASLIVPIKETTVANAPTGF